VSGGASTQGKVSWVAPGITIRREVEGGSLDTPSEIVGGRRVQRVRDLLASSSRRNTAKPPGTQTIA